MVAQTDGSTQGSLVGATMVVVAFVLVFTVLTVTREELAAREDGAVAHLG
ncbi:hypothetical protein V3N99_17195 [Dermatophilaceae bacterium Soc4.6]